MMRSAGLAFQLRRAWFAWAVLLSLAWVWAGAVGMPGAFAPKGHVGVAAITASPEVTTVAKSAQAQRPAEGRSGLDPGPVSVPTAMPFGNGGFRNVKTKGADRGILPTRHHRPQPQAPPLA